MFQQQKDWETRENAFAAFTMGPLTDFWRQRDEAEFTGVDDIPVRFVRFRAQHHDRVVVICPGRIESYRTVVVNSAVCSKAQNWMSFTQEMKTLGR